MISNLPADILGLCFSWLPIADIKSVFRVCRRWNKIANSDIFWIKIAQSLPIPDKISDRHLQYYPEWKIYTVPGKEKEKVKQFLLTSRRFYLYVTTEKLEFFDRPFSYRSPGGGGANFYPDYLGPESFNIWNYLPKQVKLDREASLNETMREEIHLSYPWGPRTHPVIPVCVHDSLGQPIRHFPNSSQYFYLLNKKEGDQLYWVFNRIFYRIICAQQSPHSNLKEQPFEKVILERVKEFIQREELSQEHINRKQDAVKALFALAEAEKFDTRWLLIQ